MLPEEVPILRTRSRTVPTDEDADPVFVPNALNPAAPARRNMFEPGEPPINIGHRGFKAAYPENTMASFKGAVAAGAHAIETDLHLSKDGVVVLSHDATLKRCFGIDKRVADCDWSELSTLRTVQPPHEPLPRLADLLAWLTTPDLDHLWLLLDIKTDDDPELMLASVAETLDRVPIPPGCRPWNSRVALGCWNDQFINLSRRFLPGHPIFLISFSVLQAFKYLPASDDEEERNADPEKAVVHFNMFQPSLVGPLGARFRREARKRQRKVCAWTVDDERWMRWCVEVGVDGVVTDEVGKFAEVRRVDSNDDVREEGASAGLDGEDSSKEIGDEKKKLLVVPGERPGWKLYVRAGLLQGAAMLLAVVWRKGFWHKSPARKKMRRVIGKVVVFITRSDKES
ncbi:hypothetical protein VTJ04DRAFT_10103 [Mycothermus thermophilus]|uniref:uncharacterized protein n=1 Tax=Humicola insolens TaxID=85995 RepID=UPI003742B9FE